MPLLLTREGFDACLGQRFDMVAGPDASRAVALTRVTPLATHANAARESFSLIFESDEPDAWPQGNYDVTHATLGSAPIFLVPIGPDPESKRMRYQAIFN